MANIKISDLPLATLPLDAPNAFIEIQTVEAGVDVSRKVASDNLPAFMGAVDVSGTPLDNQVAVWIDSNTIEGLVGLTFDDTLLTTIRGLFNETADIDLVDANVALVVGGVGSAQHIEIDHTAIQKKTDETSTGTLDLNPLGGNVDIGPQSGSGQVEIFTDGLEQMDFGGDEIEMFSQSSPGIGSAQDLILHWQQQDGSVLMDLGYDGAIDAIMALENHGASLIITSENNAGVSVGLLTLDPDADEVQVDTPTLSIQPPAADEPILKWIDANGAANNTVFRAIVDSAGLTWRLQASLDDESISGDAIIVTRSFASISSVEVPVPFIIPAAGSMQIFDDRLMAWGTGFDVNMKYDSVDAMLEFNSSTAGVRMSSGIAFQIAGVGNEERVQFQHDETDLNVVGTLTTDIHFSGITGLRQDGVLHLLEQAAAVADTAAYGQIWVRNDVPNVLVFTDDTGADFVIGGAGSTVPAVTDEQTLVAVGTVLTASDFFKTDNADIITLTGGFGDTFTFDMSDGITMVLGGSGIDAIAFGDRALTQGSIGNAAVYSQSYVGTIQSLETNTAAHTLRLGNGSTPWGVIEIFQGATLEFLEVGGLNPIDIVNSGSHLQFDLSDAGISGLQLDGNAVLKMDELALAPADTADYGQYWVRDDVPNTPMFTDDAGNDFVLNSTTSSTLLVDSVPNVAVIAEGLGLVGLRSVGDTDAEDRVLQFEHSDGTVRMSIGNESASAIIIRNHITGANIVLRVGIGGGNRDRIICDGDQTTGGVTLFGGTSPGSGMLQAVPKGVFINNGTLFLTEQAASEVLEAAKGQLWVRDDVANMLMFTDDSDTEMTVPATQFINKDADETINNTSAYQDDDELVGFQMDAGAIYRVRIAVNVLQVSAAAGFKIRIIGEGAGTFIGAQFGTYSISESTGVVNGDQQAAAQGEVTNTVGDNYVVLEGICEVGNGDTFKVQWAQSVATVANTIVENESYIEVTKIRGS